MIMRFAVSRRPVLSVLIPMMLQSMIPATHWLTKMVHAIYYGVPGDVIGIFGSEQGSNVKAVLDPATDGMRKGVFDYVGTISGIFCGYYPYNAEATLNGDLLTIELPRVQQYTPSSVFSPNVTIMAGYLRDTENELQFRNACSILEIQLTGEERITSLSLLSESKALSGKGTVNLADEEPKFIISEGVEGNANEIVLDLGDEGVQLTSDPTPFYFVIPAGTYPDLKVVAYADEFAFHRKSTQSHLLQPRHIVPMKPFAVGKPDYASAVDLSLRSMQTVIGSTRHRKP